MAWTDSRIMREFVKSTLGDGQTSHGFPGGYLGLTTDAVKGTLFGGNTPDKDATNATSGYNSGSSQWTTASEKTGGGSSDWVTGGRALSSKTFSTPSSGVVMFDAADLTSVQTSTLSGVEGIFIYDDAITATTGGVADLGVCYNYFGGAQSVTSGTFSVVFNTNGIFRFTV